MTSIVHTKRSHAKRQSTADSAAVPQADNTLDLGTATMRWNDLFLGGDLFMSGGDLGIGTATPTERLFVEDGNIAVKHANDSTTAGLHVINANQPAFPWRLFARGDVAGLEFYRDNALVGTLASSGSGTTTELGLDSVTNSDTRIELRESSSLYGYVHYDGSVNQLNIGSSTSGDVDAIRINRGSADVAVLGNLNLTGNLNVTGTISGPTTTSSLWFSGLDLVLHSASTSSATLEHFTPGSSNWGRIFRNSSAGTVTTLLSLGGLPQQIQGKQVTVTGINVVLNATAGDFLDSVHLFEGETTIVSDLGNHSSDFSLVVSEDVSNHMALSFTTSHDGSGTNNRVQINAVQVFLSH